MCIKRVLELNTKLLFVEPSLRRYYRRYRAESRVCPEGDSLPRTRSEERARAGLSLRAETETRPATRPDVRQRLARIPRTYARGRAIPRDTPRLSLPWQLKKSRRHDKSPLCFEMRHTHRAPCPRTRAGQTLSSINAPSRMRAMPSGRLDALPRIATSAFRRPRASSTTTIARLAG